MPRDKRRFVGQAHLPLAFQHAQGRDGICHDCRLRIFGQRQRVLRPFAHQAKKIVAQCVVNFLKNLARNRTRLGQRATHAQCLAALARKNECAHDPSST